MVSICDDGGLISHSHVEVPGFYRSSSAAPFSVFTCVSAVFSVCMYVCRRESYFPYFLGRIAKHLIASLFQFNRHPGSFCTAKSFSNI